MTPKAVLQEAAILCALGWLAVTGFTCVLGLGDGIWRDDRCQSPIRRVEYVVPGYRLGCWLGGFA